MSQWCLMVGEMQSCVGLMATTLLSLWSVTAVSTMTNSLILESLQPWLTIQFLCQHLSSLPGFHFWHLISLSCASPTLVCSCAFCCGTCVLASVPSPFVHVFPLHQLHCQQFCSLFFAPLFSSLWPLITTENGSCTFLLPPQRQTPCGKTWKK